MFLLFFKIFLVFVIFKIVHSKFYQELREALLKPQKQTSFSYTTGTALGTKQDVEQIRAEVFYSKFCNVFLFLPGFTFLNVF